MTDTTTKSTALEAILNDRIALTPAEQEQLANLRKELKQELGQIGIEGVVYDREKYSLAAIVTDILPVLEVNRQNALTTNRKVNYNQIVATYLAHVETDFKTESEGDGATKYWQEVCNVIQNDFVRVYENVARRRNKTESSLFYKYVLANKYTTSALTALPGLATIRMPYSTPLVMAALGYIGAKFIHPRLMHKANEDLLYIAEFVVHQQKRIDETALDPLNIPELFTPKKILQDLLPMLETARLGGKDFDAMSKITNSYFELLKEDYKKLDLGESRYLAKLEYFVTEEFLPRFNTYAVAQTRIEEKGLGYKLVTNKWVDVVLANTILSPLYLSMARTNPYGAIEDIAMIGIISVLGYNIPRLINPGQEDIRALYDDIYKKYELLEKE